MKREIPKTTFVGPITKRRKSHSFLILQGGMDPIKLEYPTEMVSRQSRAQLLEPITPTPWPRQSCSWRSNRRSMKSMERLFSRYRTRGTKKNVPTLSPDEDEDSPAHRAKTVSRESPAGQNAELNQGKDN